MGIGELVFCNAFSPSAPTDGIRHRRAETLAFVVIVFGNQATTYTNRERRHLWSSRPSIWLIVSSVADLLIASTLAVGGIAMTPLPACRGRHACRGSCLRADAGFCEGSGFPPSWDHLEPRLAAERTKMKINSKDFRVREGDEVDLKKWPTKVDPVTNRRSNTRNFWKSMLRS